MYAAVVCPGTLEKNRVGLVGDCMYGVDAGYCYVASRSGNSAADRSAASCN